MNNVVEGKCDFEARPQLYHFRIISEIMELLDVWKDSSNRKITKSKSHYDRQPVGQCVLVSSPNHDQMLITV
jgi:hypothetical protein